VSVDPDISRQIMEEELAAMEPLAATYGWVVCPDLPNLTVTVRMRSAIDGEVYLLEARCDGYKAQPPVFEFVHPESGERGTSRCYPKDGNFFHAMPCICIQWNRKAYQPGGGPHPDWPLADWMSTRPTMQEFGGMFNLVQRQINHPTQYQGRMG
jgi:hypothetical protein